MRDPRRDPRRPEAGSSSARHLLSRLLVILLAAAVVLAPRPAHAGGLAQDLDQTLQAEPTGPALRLIVQVSCPLDLGPLSQLTLITRLVSGVVVATHPAINAVTMIVPRSTVRLLATLPGVIWVSPDRLVAAAWDEDTATTGADQVWAQPGGTGGGARIAVLDTGVVRSPEWGVPGGSRDRLVGWLDLVGLRLTPYDDSGHGTHVAGIALGAGQLSGTTGPGAWGRFMGVAPGADLVAVKVLRADGSGNVSTVLAGLEYCLLMKSTLRVRVVNLSLGHPPGESSVTDPLCRMVRVLVQSGVTVVCSAGNLGKDASGRQVYGGISSPGIEPAVITVGALNTRESARRRDDTVCTFSSRGPTWPDWHVKPDLVAPGNRIVSLRAPGSVLDLAYPELRVAPERYQGTGEPVYTTFSGTSMAAPQVAGTVALLASVNPGLTPNAVKAVLLGTAQPLALTDGTGSPLPEGLSLLHQGSGSLNALGAFHLAAAIDPSRAEGTCWLTRPLQPWDSIAGETAPWGLRMVWGNGLGTGNALLAVRWRQWRVGSQWGSGDSPGEEYSDGGGTDPGPQPGSDQLQVVWADTGRDGQRTIWGESYLGGDAGATSAAAAAAAASVPWGD